MKERFFMKGQSYIKFSYTTSL